MADFNNDNSIIDTVINNHLANSTIHMSADEKEAVNQPFVTKSYTGNGNVSREITITDSFNPKWGFIFRVGYTPSIIDIENETNYNYFSVFTANGSMAGLSLSGKTLTVEQASIPVFGSELKSFNELGSAYMIIAFR